MCSSSSNLVGQVALAIPMHRTIWVSHGSQKQLDYTIGKERQKRSCRFVQRIQGVRGAEIYRNEDWPQPQVALRQGRVEGDEGHSGLVADQLCGDEASRRTRAGRIRGAG